MTANPVVPHVVVLGAGFGGLSAARELADAPVRVTLVDRHNYHLFQPLLYQVATAGLEPADIAYAVRGIFHRSRGVHVRAGEVVGVDWERRQLEFADEAPLAFDHLVIAAGAVTATFGIPGVDEHAFGLKSVSDAVALRSHVLSRFELADAQRGLVDGGALTFVVVGGGPTGVELAGALAELFRNVLTKDYPSLDVTRARVVLVEATDALLTPFDARLRAHAVEELRARGVDVRLDTAVDKVTEGEVHLSDGSVIATQTLVWAAGVRANPLADVLGLEQTKGGRIVVDRSLRVPGHDGVYAVGDVAASLDRDGSVLPQLAPVAMQGAKHAAKQIKRNLVGQPPKPFRYLDKGTMATIGRNAAVAELPFGIRITGFPAWLSWLFLHLVLLVGFRNRLSVLLNWAWSYITYDRAARLIFAPEAYGGRRPPGGGP